MRGKKTRVLAILVVLVMMIALMPAQTAMAEPDIPGCFGCGQPGVLQTSGVYAPGTTFHWFECTNQDCDVSYYGEGHIGGEATCTAKAVCEICGIEYGDLKQHTGGTATCTDKAVCENCQQEYGGLDSNKHTGTSTVTGKKGATCTEKGYTGDTYWDCCDATIKGEEIAALGHDWGAWTVTKEATTSEEGIETRVCKNDSSHTETRTIAKKEETNEEESEEKTTKANSESKTKKTTTDSQPQTGDESQSTWVIMMMLSAALLIALIRRRIYIRE